MCLITDAKIQTIPETAWTQISGIIYNISEKIDSLPILQNLKAVLQDISVRIG